MESISYLHTLKKEREKKYGKKHLADWLNYYAPQFSDEYLRHCAHIAVERCAEQRSVPFYGESNYFKEITEKNELEIKEEARRSLDDRFNVVKTIGLHIIKLRLKSLLYRIREDDI